jgi:hypothetical protein
MGVLKCLQFAAAITALGSGGLWWWASAMVRPVLPSAWASGPPKEVVARIKLQTWLNAWAAIATGVSAALQGIILFFTWGKQ